MHKLTAQELAGSGRDAWDEVQQLLANGSNAYSIVSRDPGAADDTLYRLQVSTRSYLGTVAYRTGGILFDHGWIRLLGSGGAGIYGSLTDWNGLKDGSDRTALEGMLVVAYDAAGGFFALDTGRFGQTGHVYYFAPDTLEWESTELAYSGFLNWLAEGDLGLFYQSFRWEDWQEEMNRLGDTKVFAYYPPLWTQEGGGESSSKAPVLVTEAWQAARDSG